MPNYEISWRVGNRAGAVREFRVYSGDKTDRGTRIATVPADEQLVNVSLDEGSHHLRTYAVGADGQETLVAQRRCRVTGRRSAPPTPRNAAFHHVEPSMGLRFTMDVPYRNDGPHKVQIVEGPSVTRGKLIAEIPVDRRGPLPPDGSRLFSAAFALEGTGAPSSVRTVWARAMGLGGKPGPAVSRTLVVPDRHTFGAGVTICSIDPAAPTVVGFPAATSSSPHEFVATDGLRLRAVPGVSGTWTGWGSVSAGLFANNNALAPYVDNAKIVTDEKDLGTNRIWCLDIYDEIQRKTEAGYWTSSKTRCLRGMPTCPADDPAAREFVAEGGTLAPFLMREIGVDGTPRQPLRDCKWQYYISTTSGDTIDEDEWIDVTPGCYVKGRYILLRLVLLEPTGWHQIIVPRIVALARPAFTTSIGTGSPEGVVSGAPGDVRVRTNGPPAHYVKVSGYGTTGWRASSETDAVLHREVADQTVANTVAETSIVNAGAGLSIPGGTLGTNRVVELLIEGIYLNNTGVNRNLIVRVYYGSTEMVEFQITNIAASTATRSFSFKVRLIAKGATNAQIATLEILQSPAGSPATGVGGFGPGASGRVRGPNSPATEDSTTALDLDVTVEHSTNSANLSLTAETVFATLPV